MTRPLFSTGTARGGTNLLAYLLSANAEISLAADPFLPLFQSLGAAIRRHRGDDRRRAWNPHEPLCDYYFADERLRAMDGIQAADLDVPFDGGERDRLLDALRRRTGLTCAYLVPYLEALGGDAYAALITSALRLVAQARQAQRCAWVGFNENWAVEFFAPLARSFPDARFLILLRDPRAAIASNRRVRDPAKIAHAPSFARHWRKCAAFAVRYQADPLFAGRLLVLTYEQLVTHPEQSARALCEFLEVAYDPRMLETDRYVDCSTGRLWTGNSNYEAAVSGIHTRSVSRWQASLPVGLARLIEFLCGPEMGLFGYHHAREGRSWSVDAGGLLASLIEEHQAPRSWRSDLGDPLAEFGYELARWTLVESPLHPPLPGALIRRLWLFDEVFARVRQGRVVQAGLEQEPACVASPPR